MKILMITKTLAEFANIQGRFREMSKLGVDLTVASPARWMGSDHEFRRIEADGYELIACRCLFSSSRSVRMGNHLHFYPGISELIGRERWDLVHIEEEPFNFATYHSLKRCLRHGRSAIFTTWQNIEKNYPPPFSFFERYAHNHAVAAIAGSKGSLDVLARKHFAKPAVHIPQLGIDPLLFRKQDASDVRRKLGLDGQFAIGFVGRLAREKGLDTLVKAMALLPQDSVLVLVGSGRQQRRLSEMVETFGLSRRVRWVPWVNSGAVAEYMNAFDVLALPSRTRWNVKEQFGRVLVEAMACEVCVVGSDSGEIPNVIADAGLVFHEGNERELAGCLRTLMDDNFLRESFRRRARNRALGHFSHARIAKETTDFYSRFCFGG